MVFTFLNIKTICFQLSKQKHVLNYLCIMQSDMLIWDDWSSEEYLESSSSFDLA